MAQESYAFWQMVLTSPVAIALAGAIGGSFITLVVTLLKFRHDANESKKIWERQEDTRKEQRLFELKLRAYENFADCFIGIAQGNGAAFDQNIVPVAIRLSNYGSQDVREETVQFMNILMQGIKVKASRERDELFQSLIECGNVLHGKIIADISSHHQQENR